MMNLIARVPSQVSSSTSVSPVKRSYGSQDPWSTRDKKKERSKRPDLCIDRMKASINNLWKASLQQTTQSGMTTALGRSQEWKTDIETHERSGRRAKISWRMIRKVRPGFSHKEIRLDGTAQSVRNEETPRDRSGRPDIDSQEKAWPQQFVIGNDEAVESRSFMNRVNDQMQERQKKGFECYRKWRKTFYDLANVHGCNNRISNIHGKELPEQLSLHCEHDRSHTQTNVRHICKIGVRTR